MMQLGSLFRLWFSPSVSLSFSLSLSDSRSAILTLHPPTAETLPHLRSSTAIDVVELQHIANLKSGGMNGYLSLCNGDPCPLIFRFPVTGMEDIMNNQVLCAIYKLPDFHKHITQPPAGLYSQRSVTLGDLKPALVLWHEDSGRRPWESRRLLNMGMREALYCSKPA